MGKWFPPKSFLMKLTMGALLVDALAYAIELLTLGIDREVTIIVIILLVAGLLVATGWRWTPALGAFLAGGILFGNPFLMFNLSQPITSGFFLPALFQVLSTMVVVVASVGALVQNYRRRRLAA